MIVPLLIIILVASVGAYAYYKSIEDLRVPSESLRGPFERIVPELAELAEILDTPYEDIISPSCGVVTQSVGLLENVVTRSIPLGAPLEAIITPSVPLEKFGPYHPCSENWQCKNGACARETAASGAEIVCCPSGKSELYGGYWYCQGMPNGSTCWSDAMCGSGNCKGNLGGLRKGVCA